MLQTEGGDATSVAARAMRTDWPGHQWQGVKISDISVRIVMAYVLDGADGLLKVAQPGHPSPALIKKEKVYLLLVLKKRALHANVGLQKHHGCGLKRGTQDTSQHNVVALVLE